MKKIAAQSPNQNCSVQWHLKHFDYRSKVASNTETIVGK